MPKQLTVIAVALLCLAACREPSTAQDARSDPSVTSSPQLARNKANFAKLFDVVIDQGRLDLADQYINADRPDHQEFGLPPEMTKGYDGFRRVVGMFRAAFPDLRFTSQYMVAEGDLVFSYNIVEGTQQAAFLGVPSSGKHFRVQAMDVCRFDAAGKVSEHWGVFDLFGMMVQLGAIPAPGQAPSAAPR
jgi:predicted ester cyclase